MATLHEVGEFGLIQALAARFAHLPEGWLGIGDDCAITRLTPGLEALTTVDLLVEDVHFRRHTTSARDLGHKSLAVSLSDIAAMGGTPRWAVLGLALPPDTALDWVLDFYEGLAALAETSGCALVGGDTVRAAGSVTIALTLVGEAERPLTRTGARPGDTVFTTGPAGLAAAGLWCLENTCRVEASSPDRRYIDAAARAHCRPEPQLAAGAALRRLGCRVALMDNSDGLARSAIALAERNKVDLHLEESWLPIDAATRAIARQAGVSPVHWALDGGEDYTLVGCVGQRDEPAVAEALKEVGVEYTPVGKVFPGPGMGWLVPASGTPRKLGDDSGFGHFA